MLFVRYTSKRPSYILIVLRIQKKQVKCNFHYAAMFMMTSQISKFVDFAKTQKSRYFENETLFFLQIKKFINYTARATL